MSYNIRYTPFFEREFKKLSKKYASLTQDLATVISDLMSIHVPVNPSVMIATKYECALPQKIKANPAAQG